MLRCLWLVRVECSRVMCVLKWCLKCVRVCGFRLILGISIKVWWFVVRVLWISCR